MMKTQTLTHKYNQTWLDSSIGKIARRWMLVLLVLTVTPVAVADDEPQSAQWTLEAEHWYTLQMGDMGSGWMQIATYTDGTLYRMATNMHMRISRMGEAGEMTMASTFVETEDGKAVKMTAEQVMSAQAMHNEWRFEDDIVIHTARQGERETQREVSRPEGVWLTPRGVERFVRERLNAEAKELTYRMLGPDSGMTPVEVQSRRVGNDTFTSNGKDIPVSVWTTTTSIMPIETIEHYTAEGQLVFQETPTGLGTMTMRRVSKEEALGIQVVDGEMPMLPQTFITPNAPMDNIMQTRTATLVLRAKSGDLPEIPQAGAQRVERGEDDSRVTLVIDIDDNLSATDEELNDARYTDASPMIDSDDAMIRALTRRALREAGLTSEDDAMKRAEAMRAFVHGYMTNPNLDVPFASASETARTRSGDCTEFGVLLAAMLRADGIPARVASGLVYADQFAGSDTIFGWHMWTQAIIDGKWVDFDATLPVRHHAGHVLTGTSSLADGQGANEMAAMILLIGNLEIDVEDVGY